MKRRALNLASAIVLALVMSTPAGAALEQQPAEQFMDPSLAGVGNLLFPSLLNLPIAGDLGSMDCLFGGSLTLAGDASISITGLGYAVFFTETTGYVPLVVEGGGTDLELQGSLHVVADDCEIIPFVPTSFDWEFINPEVSAEEIFIAFVTTPYLNTDTDKIVLDTRDDSLVAVGGIEILWDLFGLEEIPEGLLEIWLRDYLSDLLLNEGVLATTKDGGDLHDVLEDAMNGIFLPHMCGCVTVTQGTPHLGHLVANMGLYLLPVALILGLRRRVRS